MSAVQIAELVISYQGEDSSFRKVNLDVQQSLLKTAVGAEETAEAMLHLAASVATSGSAYETASVQGATYTRIALDSAKATQVAAAAFAEATKGAVSVESALDIATVAARAATVSFGEAGTAAGGLGTSSAAARVEVQALGRTLGSSAATGYAQRAQASTMAVEALGLRANASAAEIAALNASLTASKGLLMPGATRVSGGSGAASTLGRIESVGSGVSKIGLPLLAIGAAAVAVDTKFEAATARIEGFAGASHDEIVRLTPQFLKLGEATGIMGSEVADGFFHIRSAIHDTAQSNEVLNVSAKAAAAGLGHMEEVANVITSGRYSFGKTAAEIGDVVAKAAVLSHADPSAFFKNMGQAIPIAATLKMRLNDIAGLVAIMTREGLSPAKGFQRVTAMMDSLSAPTKGQRNVAKMLGIDFGEFRIQMQQNIGAALEEVYTKSKGNLERIRAFFGARRAGDAALAFFNPNAVEENIKVLHEMANAAGTVDRAFSVASKTTQFQMRQTAVAVNNAAIAMGAALAPTAQALAGDVRYLADGFAHLNPGIQQFLVVGGGAVAITGFIASKAVAAVGAISAMRTASAALGIAQAAQAATAGTAATATAAEGVAATAAAGGVGLLNVALLPEIAILGAVALAAYGLYKAYQFLTGAGQTVSSITLDDAKAQAASATAKLNHAQKVRILYREVEALSAKTHRSKDESDQLSAALNALDRAAPQLIKGYDGMGNAIGYVAGQFNTGAAAARDFAQAVMQAHQANVLKRYEETIVPVKARQAQAQYDLFQIEKHGVPGIYRKPSATESEYSHDTVDRSVTRPYDKDFAGPAYQQAHRDAAHKLNQVNKMVSDAHAEVIRANDLAKGYTPEALKVAKAYGVSAQHVQNVWAAHKKASEGSGGGGGRPPIDYGDGGLGGADKKRKGRSPGESQGDKDADQLLQSLKDRVGNLATAYALLGSNADATSLKQEILGGEFASTSQKAAALASVIEDLRKRGTLDFAAGDLFGKGTKFDSLGGTAKLKAEAYALQLVTDKRKASTEAIKAENEAAKQALASAQQAANQATREALAAVATSDEDRLSILAYGVPVSELPGIVGKVRAKLYAAAYAQQARGEKDKLAAEYHPDADLFDDGKAMAAENRAKRAQAIVEATAKSAENYREIMQRLAEKKGEGEATVSLAARRKQAIQESINDLKATGNVFVDAYRAIQVGNASGGAFDAAPLKTYRDMIRQLTREMRELGGQSDATRLKLIMQDADGVERMRPEDARKVLNLEKLLDKEKAFRERNRQVGESAGKAFSDGLNATLDRGGKAGLKAFIQSADQQIREQTVGNAAKGFGAWVTRSLNHNDPNRKAMDEATGAGKGGPVVANTSATIKQTTVVKKLTGRIEDLIATMGGSISDGDAGSVAGMASGIASGEAGGVPDWLSSVFGMASTALPGGSILGSVFKMLPHFAHGGDVRAGQAAIVGDGGDGSGTEMIVPKTDSRIIPHTLTQSVLSMVNNRSDSSRSQSVQEGDNHIHINVAGAGKVERRDLETIRRSVQDGIESARRPR